MSKVKRDDSNKLVNRGNFINPCPLELFNFPAFTNLAFMPSQIKDYGVRIPAKLAKFCGLNSARTLEKRSAIARVTDSNLQ